MINKNFPSLLSTCPWFLFILRKKRDAPNVTLYYFIVRDHIKLLTSNERAGSLFHSLMIITYICLFFIRDYLTISKYLVPACFKLSLNYTLIGEFRS